MTKEEAYNSMSEGYLVSHKDWSNEQFVFMTENYWIKDENLQDFEQSWDKLDEDQRWATGWYIYKSSNPSLVQKRRFLNMSRKDNVNQISQKDLISHVPGKQCPGKEKCMQYCNIAGETACLICDVNDASRFIDVATDIDEQVNGYLKYLPDSNIAKENVTSESNEYDESNINHNYDLAQRVIEYSLYGLFWICFIGSLIGYVFDLKLIKIIFIIGTIIAAIGVGKFFIRKIKN